jgi:hypothetical protein
MSNLVDPKTIAATFWDTMEVKDFTVPRVELGQNVGKIGSGGKAGKFVFNTGEVRDSMLECKLLVPTKTRVLYGAGSARCASDNFFNPSDRIQNPVSANCLTCPVAQWGEDPLKDKVAEETKPKNYNPKKPLCNETYNLLMADKDWNLFFIKFQKTQLKIVSEKLFTRLRYNFGANPPYEVAFDLKSVPVDDTYFNIEFDNFRVIPDEQKTVAQDAYMSWSSRAKDVLAKQHKEMDESHDEPIPF